MIVPFYASLLALLFVFLSVRALRTRRRLKIAIGDAGNPVMVRAMRVHSNFAEYVPLSLLLFYFVEVGGARPWLVHALALSLLLGRLTHAYGASQAKENFAFRVAGMVMTLSSLLVAALYLLFLHARNMP